MCVWEELLLVCEVSALPRAKSKSRKSKKIIRNFMILSGVIILNGILDWGGCKWAGFQWGESKFF